MQARLPLPGPAHPAASVLRHRAGELRDLADAIERATVFTLDTGSEPGAPGSRRAALCRRLLARNLHQLLQAADDLRDTAWRYHVRAAHLDNRPPTGHAA